MCDSIRGILVHSSIYDELTANLKSDISKIVIGSPTNKTTQIGAVLQGTSARVETIIKKSLIKDGDLWNYSVKDNIIKPSLILNPEDVSPIILENIFAPIIWIRKVANYSESITFYNKKNVFGLGFSVFCNDKKHIDEFINKIKVGRLNINKDPIDIGIFDPWGGIKISGKDGPSYWTEKISNRKYINS
jgi:acyl-CoA reductase-like NAD-dependent aldehyde dehydrogenase